MPLTNSGAVLAATLIQSDGPYYVAAGDSSTAFLASQTDLIGTNAREVASASRSSNVVTYTATFGTSVANFEWLEVGLANASSGGTLLTRRVVTLPTKTSSDTWTVNLEVVFAAA